MSSGDVESILRDAADLCAERNKFYGDTHTDIGGFLHAMFPRGVGISGKEDWSRLFMLMQCANKLLRYAGRMVKGGHVDSARDLCVYAAMLEAITNEKTTHAILASEGHGGRAGASQDASEEGP